MNNSLSPFGGGSPLEPHGHHSTRRDLMRSLDDAEEPPPLDNLNMTGMAAPALAIPSKVKSGSNPTPTHTAESDHTPHYGHEPSSPLRFIRAPGSGSGSAVNSQNVESRIL